MSWLCGMAVSTAVYGAVAKADGRSTVSPSVAKSIRATDKVTATVIWSSSGGKMRDPI